MEVEKEKEQEYLFNRILIYGGCKESPKRPEVKNMIILAKELRLLFKGVEVMVVDYGFPGFSVLSVDEEELPEDELRYDEKTVVIAHSYGCLVAKHDIYAHDNNRIFKLIQLSPFSIQSYLELENPSEEECKEFAYGFALQFYTVPTRREETEVIYGDYEHSYNKDGWGYLNLKPSQFHRVAHGTHGLSLHDPSTLVFQEVLRHISIILNRR